MKGEVTGFIPVCACFSAPAQELRWRWAEEGRHGRKVVGVISLLGLPVVNVKETLSMEKIPSLAPKEAELVSVVSHEGEKRGSPYQEPYAPYIDGVSPGHAQNDLGCPIRRGHGVAAVLTADASLPQVADGKWAGAPQQTVGDVDEAIASSFPGRWIVHLVVFHRGENRVVCEGNKQVVRVKVLFMAWCYLEMFCRCQGQYLITGMGHMGLSKKV